MSQIAVSPATFWMTKSEKLPLSFDPTNYLLQGEVPVSPTVIVTDTNTGANVTATTTQGAATVASQAPYLITQTFIGTNMVAGHNYRVEVTFSIGSTKTWDMELTIICLY